MCAAGKALRPALRNSCAGGPGPQLTHCWKASTWLQGLPRKPLNPIVQRHQMPSWRRNKKLNFLMVSGKFSSNRKSRKRGEKKHSFKWKKGSPKRKPKKDIYLNKKIVLDLYLGKKQPIQSIALLHTPKVYPKNNPNLFDIGPT